MSSVKSSHRDPSQTPDGDAGDDMFLNRAVRETVESVVIAFVLAFLFRAFEAEAFVIPTGSMAPTLQGRHKDLICERCKYEFRVGDSEGSRMSEIRGGTCPICRYTMVVDSQANPNHCSFSGDRILVNKFAFEMGNPQRWDVIVFKYPGNAKINYIKRLVGLPGETLKIRHGNVYIHTAKDADGEFHIARKPPHKVVATLQLVDDTEHLPKELAQNGWPLRWHGWKSGETQFEDKSWTTATEPDAMGHEFKTDGTTDGDTWLRYRHFLPNDKVWAAIDSGTPLAPPSPQLITDFCTYNEPSPTDMRVLGRPHWVSDLGLECTAVVGGSQGELLLNLVAGGRHHTCRINVQDGSASLAIDGNKTPFVDLRDRPTNKEATAKTSIRGPGTYRLRWTNVDDELRLWVNDYPVEFSAETTYVSPPDLQPVSTASDPGDAAPAGIGSRGLPLTVKNLRIYRDVYYLATKGPPNATPGGDDYDDYVGANDEYDVRKVLRDPKAWSTTSWFKRRREVILPGLGEEQYLPLGDNSPQSKDGRLWTDEAEPFVRRDLLIGKALAIYFPHLWYVSIPGTGRSVPIEPNLSQMKLIR